MTTLRVGVACPDPPFNGMPDGGLDIDLMSRIAAALGMAVDFVHYEDADCGGSFNGIFDELGRGRFDCVAAGTTVTPERERRAAFAPPYLISGQALAVDTARWPRVRSVDDLAGLTVGVQQGNTSQPVAHNLVAQGKAAAVRVYDYGSIRAALTDLSAGGCDAVMKLRRCSPNSSNRCPVSRWCSGASPPNPSRSPSPRPTASCSAESRLRKPTSRGMARCSRSGEDGWATHSPIRV